MDHKKPFMEMEANGDRISKLPDCVLSYIVSKLTIKDLVRTRLVSKTWLNLWESRRNLDFDFPNMFNHDFPPHVFLDHTYLDQILEEFVKRVRQFKQTFPGSKIDSLRITLYDFPYKYAFVFDDWITLALSKGVEEIDMSPHPLLARLQLQSEMTYMFPKWLFSLFNQKNVSNLKYLSLRNYVLPQSPLGLHNLKTLRLDTTLVAKCFIACLHSHAPALEILCFRKCGLPSNLDIVGGSSLRHLEVIDCLYKENVRISALKLTVFEYRSMGGLKNIVFSINAPQLTKAFFRTSDPVISQLSGCPLLENLSLHLSFSDKIHGLPTNIPLLANLKQLELTIYHDNVLGCSDLVWASAFLKASPLLQKLTLRRTTAPHGYSENDSEIWEPQKFTHSQLKEVEIARCVGNWYETEFAIFMLQHVHGLEQLVFNPSRRYYNGGGEWSEGKGTIDLDAHRYWQESGREIVRKKLQDRVPASTKLVLL